ncbi:MAG: flavodoxin family protein [Firmicutes bacterium]|nr:flavodoxin family protein [Bacillota bacterium]
MKWLAVIGSPNENGNSSVLIDILINTMEEQVSSVDIFKMTKPAYSVCTNCEKCLDTGLCIINDEISSILSRINSYDGIILATPTYNSSVSSQMKIFLDRTFCLNDYMSSTWKSRVDADKKAILISSCKGNREESLGYSLQNMRNVVEDLGIEVISDFGYINTKEKFAKDDKELKKKMRDLVNCWLIDLN